MTAQEQPNNSLGSLVRPFRDATALLSCPVPGLFHHLSAMEDLLAGLTQELPLVGFSPLGALPHQPYRSGDQVERRAGSGAGLGPRRAGGPASARPGTSTAPAPGRPLVDTQRSESIPVPKRETPRNPTPVFSLKRQDEPGQGPRRAGDIPAEAPSPVGGKSNTPSLESGGLGPGQQAELPTAAETPQARPAPGAKGSVGPLQGPSKATGGTPVLLNVLADDALNTRTSEGGKIRPDGSPPVVSEGAESSSGAGERIAGQTRGAPFPGGQVQGRNPGLDALGSAFNLLDSLADMAMKSDQPSTYPATDSSRDGPANRGLLSGPGAGSSKRVPGPGNGDLSGQAESSPAELLNNLSRQPQAPDGGRGEFLALEHLLLDQSAPGAGISPWVRESQSHREGSSGVPDWGVMPDSHPLPGGRLDFGPDGPGGQYPAYGQYDGLDMGTLASLVNEVLIQEARRHGVDLI